MTERWTREVASDEELAPQPVARARRARQKPRVRQGDITRAINAVRRAGLDVARVEVDTEDGRIVLIMVSTAGSMPQPNSPAPVADIVL